MVNYEHLAALAPTDAHLVNSLPLVGAVLGAALFPAHAVLGVLNEFRTEGVLPQRHGDTEPRR